MQLATKAEKLLFQRVACPICDALISRTTRLCTRCHTYFALGSLDGLRTPKHAKVIRQPRDWVKRFLGK